MKTWVDFKYDICILVLYPRIHSLRYTGVVELLMYFDRIKRY